MKMLRALILEPDLAVRRQVTTLLSESGFDSTEASDCVRAIQLASDCGVDLIVADSRVPKLAGLPLGDYVRSGAFGSPPPPLIILSASPKDEVAQIGNPAPQGVAVLEKPFSSTAFAAALNAAFPVE